MPGLENSFAKGIVHLLAFEKREISRIELKKLVRDEYRILEESEILQYPLKRDSQSPTRSKATDIPCVCLNTLFMGSRNASIVII